MVLHHRIFWSEATLHDRVRMGLDLDLGFQNTHMNGFQNTDSLNTAVGVSAWCPNRDRGQRSRIDSISVDGRRLWTVDEDRRHIDSVLARRRHHRLRWRWN